MIVYEGEGFLGEVSALAMYWLKTGKFADFIFYRNGKWHDREHNVIDTANGVRI